MPNPTHRHAFLGPVIATVIAAPFLAPCLALAQAPASQAAQPSAPAAAPAPAAQPPAPSDAKSLEVLAEVRKAIGGDAKIAALKTASFEGTYRRVMGEQDMTGDLELYFALPDKFQRIEQFSLRTATPVRASPRRSTAPKAGWARSARCPAAWCSASAARAVLAAALVVPAVVPAGRAGARRRRAPRSIRPLMVKQLYWRTALAMFPGTAATSGLTFTYVGKAESPDGEADVLDAKGEGNFAARLFVDAKTHLPVMLTYQDRERNFRIKPSAAQGRRDRRAVPRPPARRA